jgi:hypothetical protein
MQLAIESFVANQARQSARLESWADTVPLPRGRRLRTSTVRRTKVINS